jgi:WD40 repeat protein
MAVTPSASVLSHPVATRTFGEARFHADGDVLALAYDSAGTLWSLESPGILRSWNDRGQAKSRHVLIDLDTTWNFSPNAKYLAAACDELMIWETATHRQTARIEVPSWVTAIAFHPHKNLVAAGHDDGITRLWDPARDEPIDEFCEHDLPVSAVAFSSDGKFLASAGEDRLIKIWDLANHRLIRTLSGHTDRITGLAWHPTTKSLVSVGWDATARVWDVTTGEPRILLNTHDDQVLGLAFANDGSLLATIDSASATYIWGDLLTAEALHRLPGIADELKALAFRGDKRQLAVSGTDRVIRVYDPQSGQLIAGHAGNQRHAIAIWGENIASVAGEMGLQIWDQRCNDLSSPLPRGDYLHVAASADGRWLAAATPDSRIQLWDAQNRKLTSLDGPKSAVKYLAFTPDSLILSGAVASEGTVWLWSLESLEPSLLVIEATEGCSVETIAWHPDGQRLLCGGIDFLSTSGSTGAVCLWDVPASKRLVSIPLGATCAAFNPSGNTFAFVSPDGWAALHATETGEPILELEWSEDQHATALTFSPDGQLLIAASADSSLRAWDTATGEILASRQFSSSVDDLAVRNDGVLYLAHQNSTVSELSIRSLTDGL